MTFVKGYKPTMEHRKKLSLSKLQKPVKYWLGKKRPDMSIKFSGKGNPSWYEDRSLLKIGREKSYDTLYKYWMREVKKRDNYKCRINNLDCKGHLEAHHILSWKDHPELRYEINNGITLCQAHHPKKRSEEAKLSPYFQKLVAEMK